MTWQQDGRTFVRFPDDMYIYQCADNGLLARVAPQDLPSHDGLSNPAIQRLQQQILAEAD